jgi:hypothetical protein
MKKIRSIATIVRPQNAMEKWLQGDPTICSFSRALDDWAGDVAQGKPLCLTCEHEFQMGNLPPAFMLVEVDVQENGRPDQLILTGICVTTAPYAATTSCCTEVRIYSRKLGPRPFRRASSHEFRRRY